MWLGYGAVKENLSCQRPKHNKRAPRCARESEEQKKEFKIQHSAIRSQGNNNSKTYKVVIVVWSAVEANRTTRILMIKEVGTTAQHEPITALPYLPIGFVRLVGVASKQSVSLLPYITS